MDDGRPCLGAAGFSPWESGLPEHVQSDNEKVARHVVLVRTLEISATPEAPAGARRWLDGISQLRPLGQVAFDVRLLVTELVANGVRHAGLDASELITVTLELSDVRLRVEVRDPGKGFAFPARPQKRDRAGGRGLQIVAAIAHRWGIDHDTPVSVWFEIDLERAGSATGAARVPQVCVRGLVP